MGFISSSRVCNIVMTSVLRKEENCENRLASGKTAPDLQQPSYLCLLLRLPLYLFASKRNIFCQDNLKCVSARCCLKMFDRGCAGKASATVRGIPASLSGSRARCSDSTLSFRLRCSIIRGWGLHHQVPSSEEFIQPLPQ